MIYRTKLVVPKYFSYGSRTRSFCINSSKSSVNANSLTSSKSTRSKSNDNENLKHDLSETVSDPLKASSKSNVFRNPSKIQMISESLYSQVFKDKPRLKEYPEPIVSKIKNHLSAHSLWDQSVPDLPSVSFTLPPIQGNSIDEHFYNIASEQIAPYQKLLNAFLNASNILNVPDNWSFVEGWTKYLENGTPESVPFPDDDIFVFDIEVCLSNGPVPVIACALSPKGWYSWCSKSFVEGTERDPKDKISVDELIPFETRKDNDLENISWKEKLIIGHNVSYDRARIKEQYFLEETKLRFLDTMSIHIAVSGITSFQRGLKMSMKNGLRPLSTSKREDLMIAGSLEWNDISALNNLKDVHQLYCGGKEIEKESRNLFVTGNMTDIRNDFQNMMSYCARDVKATYEVIQKLMPNYYERFPNPVTLAGMFEMGMTYLPVNSNWEEYIRRSEESYRQLQAEMKSVLIEKAEEAVKLIEGEKYKEDPWLWDLDWKVTKSRKKTNSKQGIVARDFGLPAWYKKLLSKESDEDYIDGPGKISTSMRVVPKLLRLCWYGFPLYHSKTSGWGYLTKAAERDALQKEDCETSNMDLTTEETDPSKIPPQFPYSQWVKIWENNLKKLKSQCTGIDSRETATRSMEDHVKNNREDVAQDLKDFIKGLKSAATVGLRTNNRGNGSFPRSIAGSSPHPNCEFRPLPHKDGANYRVGNPLAKDFLSKMEEGVLSSYNGDDIANKVVRLSKMVSYWRNNRDRIMEQLVVWVKDNGISNSNPEYKFGAILPQVSVAGTLTRRAVEKTWMTASNAYVDRVGSELKGIIQAPPHYCFVGADVDSQELWIASVIGDADFAKVHGSTALGWMTLQGSKSSGTDMHSKTATLIGIDRDQAKILNYGRIYGAGVTFAERLLMQFNHQLSSAEAKNKAQMMYKLTKGQRKYLLNAVGREVANSLPKFADKAHLPLTKDEFRQLLRQLHYPPVDSMDLVDRMIWDDGTESPMFNRLEEIANSDLPKTPILGCSISRSLVPAVVHQDFMTSRVNWVVQSSAVDYLHLMLTSMRWLFQKFGIKGRFSISVHDEVRYLVKSEDRYKAALALQITNLFTRALCCSRLGMHDLPETVAFFSCVDIDKVLRKEVTQDCVTPSNPNGLSVGYNIPKGEALTIFDILDLTKNGKLLYDSS